MWWLLLLVLIPLGYIFLSRPYKYWVKKGVKQGNPTLIFGDNWGTTFKTQSAAELAEMVYNFSSDARYVGMYQFFTPTLALRDPDLIKQITVKDFDHFLNHRAFVPEDCDPLWSKNLFALNDQKWRDMRSTLSPAFTSSKMKYMFSLISENGEQFAKYFLQQNQDVITVEMKDTFTRFANDVIANIAFGVKCDSLKDRDNEFYLMGIRVSNFFFGFWKIFKFVLYMLVPSFSSKLFDIRMFSKEEGDFFVNVIKENIASREKHGIVRPDMIHPMEARKTGLKYEESKSDQSTGFATVEESEITKNPTTKAPLTDIDIAAQALVFFLGGFDTVSSLMRFMSYELAVNPDIQERLRDEVEETSQKGKLTYEALMGMKYMDMVISESLRKWPNSVATDRICTKPYTIEPQTPEEKAIHLEKGALVWIPIFGIHRDPKYFPEPEKFDPERFSDENKHNIKPYTYLPFGSGPRNCIGSRFALLETKVLFYHILLHFEIVPVEKTKIPVVLCKSSFTLHAKGGLWLGLKRRI